MPICKINFCSMVLRLSELLRCKERPQTARSLWPHANGGSMVIILWRNDKMKRSLYLCQQQKEVIEMFPFISAVDKRFNVVIKAPSET